MSQSGLTQTGWPVEEYMVQRFVSAFSRRDSYVQIALNLVLADEIIKATGSEAGIKWYVLSAGFTRYNASYFTSPPQYFQRGGERLT